MIHVCNKYYVVEINGVKTPVLNQYTHITSKWYAPDGSEYTDNAVLEQIAQQATEENELNDLRLYLDLLRKVDWTDWPTDDNPDRKAIVLKNSDMLLGTDTNGHTYNLAMVNKWGVADFGSSELPFNINSSGRPTVQFAGESGDEAHPVSFVDDLKMIGDVRLPDGVNAQDVISMFIIGLNQEFVTSHGNPVEIDGNPFSDTDNNFTLGNDYFCLQWSENGFDKYVLWSMDKQSSGWLLFALKDILWNFNERLKVLEANP